MWSLWAEEPVPTGKNGCQIHGRWYVIEVRIHTRLQPITAKLSQWCYNVDLSEDSLKDWNPSLMLGTTVQSTNKGNFSYLALKNVSHKAPRESFLRLLQDLQTEFKVEITTGWLRSLTGENEDLQFNLTKTELAVLLLGEGNDQIRSSVRLTKIPWAETSETIFLNVSLALTEDELLLCSIEDEVVARPAPQQICSTRSEHVNQSVDQMDGEHEQKNVIKTEPPDHDTEHDEPFSLSPDLFQSYDQRCSANGAPSSATEYQRVNDTTSTPQTFSAQTVKKEASPDTLWLSSTQDIIPWKQENEIHGRWYIFQLMLLDPLERIVAELSQWSTSIDISTEFLRNWSPKLTLGITEESSSQNHNYYLILKNVSSMDIRRSLFHLLEDLKHQQRIRVSTGWVRWLTGPKNDCQLDMCISSIKLLLLGSVKEQTTASIWAARMPWLEKPSVALLDINLSNTFTKDRNKVLPVQTNTGVAPKSRLTEPVSGPVTAAGPAPPVTAARPGPPVTAAGPAPRVTAAGPGPPVTAAGPGPPVTAAGPGPPVTAAGPGTPVTAAGPGPPVTAAGPGTPVTAARPGPPATAAGPGPPATAAGPGPPVTAAGPGPPVTASVTPKKSALKIEQDNLRLHAQIRCKCSSPVGVPDKASSSQDCSKCLLTKSSCSEELRSNYQHYGCGVVRNITDEPPLLTPPATASGRSFSQYTFVTPPAQPPASASPASGRSVSQYTFVTPPASPAKGRSINNDTFLTPHTSTPTLPASVQASTSSQNDVQTPQFSHNTSGSSQHRQLLGSVPPPSQNYTLNRTLISKTDKPGLQFSQTDQSGAIHIAAALSCSSTQHNAVHTDINVPVQSDFCPSSSEAKIIRDLQQHHYTDTGQHVAFTVTSRNPLTVQCSVCNTTFPTGSNMQQFQNLRCHMFADSHAANLGALKHGDPVNAIFAWIDGIYKNKFVLKRTFAVCRCDKVEISLLPADNPYHTIHAHINSTKHKTASKKFVESKVITNYFKIKKPRRIKQVSP
ncbi:uncharacterized protein [Procambarus clarkii]